MRKKIGVGTESMRRFLRISTQRAKGSAEGAPPDGVVAGDAARVKIQNPKATTPPHGAPFLRWRGIKANPSGHQRRGFSPTKSLRLKNFEQVLAPCPASCFAFAHPFADGFFVGA